MDDDGPVRGLVGVMYPPTKGDIRDGVPGIKVHHLVINARDDGVHPILDELAPNDVGPSRGVKFYHGWASQSQCSH